MSYFILPHEIARARVLFCNFLRIDKTRAALQFLGQILDSDSERFKALADYIEGFNTVPTLTVGGTNNSPNATQLCIGLRTQSDKIPQTIYEHFKNLINELSANPSQSNRDLFNGIMYIISV